MKEQKNTVKTILVKAICEKCGGEMKPGNTVLTTWPPQYPHECKNCGNIECFNEQYPKVEYEFIKGNETEL